ATSSQSVWLPPSSASPRRLGRSSIPRRRRCSYVVGNRRALRSALARPHGLAWTQDTPQWPCGAFHPRNLPADPVALRRVHASSKSGGLPRRMRSRTVTAPASPDGSTGNCAGAAAPAKTARWRIITAWALIVVATIVALGASLDVWVKRQALDTNNWVATSSTTLEDD